MGEVETTGSDVRLCTECHQSLQAGARFCGNCRHPVTEQVATLSAFASADHVPALAGPDQVPAWAGRQLPAQAVHEHEPTFAPDEDRQEWEPATSFAEPAQRARLRSGWAGLAHHQRTVVSTALLVWLFNVPLAVFYGVVGMVAGGIGGALGDYSLLSRLPVVGSYVETVAFDLSGVPGALAGALVGLSFGIFAGLFTPILLAGGLDPINMLVVVVAEIGAALIIATLYTVYAISFEGGRLRLTGARPPSKREAELLNPVLDACAARLNLAHRPDLLIADDPLPGASAHVRHLVVSTGLLTDCDHRSDQLGGVLAHQLVHSANGDALAGVFVKGLAWPLYLSYSALSALPRLVNHSFVRVLTWVFFWPIMFSVTRILMPLQAADFRASEYRADRGATLAGCRGGLRDVLSRSAVTDVSDSGWDAAVFATRPAAELRLQALELPGETHPLPDRSATVDEQLMTTN